MDCLTKERPETKSPTSKNDVTVNKLHLPFLSDFVFLSHCVVLVQPLNILVSFYSIKFLDWDFQNNYTLTVFLGLKIFNAEYID